MADAYSVKFCGATILSASEGEYFFRKGLKRRKLVISEMPLGCGVAVKDGGYSSATHTLTLFFGTSSTTAATVEAAVYARLQTAMNGQAGTLEVPDFEAIANCVVTNVEIEDQTRLSHATSAGAALADGVGVAVTVTFEQLC